MSDSQGYKITLKGYGLNLDRDITKEIGDKIVVLILTGQGESSPNDAAPKKHTNTDALHDQQLDTKKHETSGEDLSAREYLNQHDGAKRSPDKIVTLALYLKKHDDKPTFKKADIEKAFEDAEESLPKNMYRDFQWALRAGWIAPKKGTIDEFYVTHDGSTVVTSNFPKEAVKKTKIKQPRKARKNKTV